MSEAITEMTGTHGLTADGDYFILSKLHKNGLSVDFRIVESISRDANGRIFFPVGEEIADGETEAVGDAYAFMTGFIKWDGCQQMYFTGEPALHFDYDSDVEEFMRMFRKLRDIAKQHIGEKWHND